MNDHRLPVDLERVQAIADAINEAIPNDTPSGYVMSALCVVLKVGLDRTPPDIHEQTRLTILEMFGGKDRGALQ